ncbi:MAG: D-alanyl-D-alanine carboxypeptidase [bacterium]|nr:D-alanyl-D-alanine carboxypeptidase [bacterium]
MVLTIFVAPMGGTPRGWATLAPDDGLLAPPPPEVTAEAWILYDDTFGHVLAERSPDTRRAVASTTKIMTALVVIEQSEPDATVEITSRADLAGESEIGLVPGEPPWTVEDLLAALLLQSANDAAVALAEHVGGTVAGFAGLMNAKAAELGLENTSFVNPHGLDHPDHYSSARDLLTVTLAAMDDPDFARLVEARSANLPANPDGEPRVAVNRNELLATYPGAIGVKTGFTNQALLTLVAAAERGGRRLYAVVLGSDDHFGDATALLDYGFAEFGVMTLVPVASTAPRPLISGIGPPVEGSFELLIVPEPEVAVEGNDAAVLPAAEPPPDPVADEEPVPVEVMEVERRSELPGLEDILTWSVRYWDWFTARLASR